MSQSTIRQRCLPIVNVEGVPCVLIPTTADVIYSNEYTLKEALAAFQQQILASASTVATLENTVADVTTWLIEQLGYVPAQHNTGNTYLTPLMTELERVPSVSEEIDNEQI